ncbi:prepilin-type N-terminal cleavage/methylation domain-containing protein [Anoxybacillus flavithermus]|uniref:prepilin-type N-terminal cleavage/methylation domain-containing protein n=2 Tax=Anoxybacillus flavithermus TaxID=33934 RepID=UPI0018669C92|nr:prepilin-type N-terminal cleavage/methylation domain-containing protein [Anoxybacillus flavithermus]MBE2923214.1 prepilin-type N-terminal cleavage/methylation domain-containing protein [Anoxybacillus flavithermus]MBE2931116.1 prepilin-type N-terminal cleavage/methylation domain-containing protein [Anoxybacillus flavithermus]
MLKKLIRNEKGLTLIELLAVIVILGIIAAIAIPSIGGLIENSRKDAHIANAQQMVNAARLAYTADNTVTEYTLQYLEEKKYLEPVKKPGEGSYNKQESKVVLGEDGKWIVILKSGDTIHINGDPGTIKRDQVRL